MGMPGKANFIYEFGPFRLDPGERRLSREGQPITLRAKIFDTLCVLVEAHGHLLDKDELIHRVWPDAVVEEGNLATTSRLCARPSANLPPGRNMSKPFLAGDTALSAEVREIQRRESGPWHESRFHCQTGFRPGSTSERVATPGSMP